MTVRLGTDTTKAVPSTSTSESREPLPAARPTPSCSRPRVRGVERDPAALHALEGVLGEVQRFLTRWSCLRP